MSWRHERLVRVVDRVQPACTCRRPRPAVRTTRQALVVRAELDSGRACITRPGLLPVGAISSNLIEAEKLANIAAKLVVCKAVIFRDAINDCSASRSATGSTVSSGVSIHCIVFVWGEGFWASDASASRLRLGSRYHSI